MSYSQQHLLFRVLGTFGTVETETLDIFSYGVRVAIPGASLGEVQKTNFLAAMKTPTEVFHRSSLVQAHGSAWLEKITAAYIGTNGLYVGGDAQPTTELLYASPRPQGGGSQASPFTGAMAFTIQSTIDRGRGHSGRFYVPSSMAVTSDGRWPLSNVQSARNAGRIWLDAINTAARAAWNPSAGIGVFSRLDAGVTGIVVKVAVGRAPDTQRRRDNRLDEEWEFTNLTTAATALEAKQTREYGVSD